MQVKEDGNRPTIETVWQRLASEWEPTAVQTRASGLGGCVRIANFRIARITKKKNSPSTPDPDEYLSDRFVNVSILHVYATVILGGAAFQGWNKSNDSCIPKSGRAEESRFCDFRAIAFLMIGKVPYIIYRSNRASKTKRLWWRRRRRWRDISLLAIINQARLPYRGSHLNKAAFAA